jgi:hypothetical protein
MLKVREAIERAQTYLPEVFRDAVGQQLRLEGVELTEDTKFWTITFSYQEPSNAPYGRDYKTVKLRSKDGEFIGARNGLSSSGLL